MTTIQTIDLDEQPLVLDDGTILDEAAASRLSDEVSGLFPQSVSAHSARSRRTGRSRPLQRKVIQVPLRDR